MKPALPGLLLLGVSMIAIGAKDTSPTDATVEEWDTILRLRVICAALETYHDEFSVYPATNGQLLPVQSFLEGPLPQRYQRTILPSDGWQNPLYIVASKGGYVLLSPGPDGQVSDPEATIALLTAPGGSHFRANSIPGDDMISIGCDVARRPMTHRDRQVATMASMVAIGTALSSYKAEHSSLPCSTPRLLFPQDLGEYLRTTYRAELPIRDGWGTEFQIWCSPASFVIISLGSDREPDRDYRSVEDLAEFGIGGPFEDPKHDLLYTDGRFMAWPLGRTPS